MYNGIKVKKGDRHEGQFDFILDFDVDNIPLETIKEVYEFLSHNVAQLSC